MMNHFNFNFHSFSNILVKAMVRLKPVMGTPVNNRLKEIYGMPCNFPEINVIFLIEHFTKKQVQKKLG